MLQDIVQNVAVRQHDAFRFPGGTGSINQRGQDIRRHFDFRVSRHRPARFVPRNK